MQILKVIAWLPLLGLLFVEKAYEDGIRPNREAYLLAWHFGCLVGLSVTVFYEYIIRR